MPWRDAMCGDLRAEDSGRRVTLAGWADTRRDHGGLVFVDLRDHTGKFQLDEEGVDENLRLRYRWLDMRTERMQRNLRLNHTAIAAIRNVMDERGFVDVWTPSMTRGTPEGARDFLVPVR